MTLDVIEPALIVCATTFIIFALLHQNEEGWFGRTILVSILLGLVSFTPFYGIPGYVAGIIIAFITLIKIQKYSILGSFLFLIVIELLSYIIQLGIVKYF